MRYLLDFIKRTIVGGLLFLVPLAVVVIIIGKIVSAARPAATEIVDNVVGAGAVGPFALMLILCFGLIAISFAAGLLATTIIGRRAVDSLEKAVLSRVPAYTMIKSMVADAAESLANIGKHAHATSATVEVTRGEGRVVIEIVDDGIGGADSELWSGLRGLADRVEALEGRLRVWSPTGGGTRLRAEIPCAS